ncbi:MAG: hypothetical protein ACOYNN_17155 [Terrimicrobiaceae bacterium]
MKQILSNWYLGGKEGSNGNTVWANHPALGQVRIADCNSKAIPLGTQRQHAHLIAHAVDMLFKLEDIERGGYDDTAKTNLKLLMEKINNA